MVFWATLYKLHMRKEHSYHYNCCSRNVTYFSMLEVDDTLYKIINLRITYLLVYFKQSSSAKWWHVAIDGFFDVT